MVSFGVPAQKKAFLELIQWHACSLVVLQINNCMCQGHPGCTGGDGLLSWRAQQESTGTRGQDADSQEWEETLLGWGQGKKQRKVRRRKRKGREEQAVDEEGTIYKARALSTTFCKYFLGKWLKMCSFPKVVQIWPTGWLWYMNTLWWLVRHPQKYRFLETVINWWEPMPLSFWLWAVNVGL